MLNGHHHWRNRPESCLFQPVAFEEEKKKSGLTIALSGAAGSAVNSVVTTAQSVSDESDDRLAALKIAQGVMSGVSTGQAMELAQATTGDASTAFGISASLGT